MLGQLSVCLDVSGKVAELIIGQQTLQVQVLCGDVGREMLVFVEREVDVCIAGTGVQLVVRADVLHACATDETLHVDVAETY